MIKKILRFLWGPAIYCDLSRAHTYYKGDDEPRWREIQGSAWVRSADRTVRMEITTRRSRVKTRIFWYAFGITTGVGIPLAIIKLALEVK